MKLAIYSDRTTVLCCRTLSCPCQMLGLQLRLLKRDKKSICLNADAVLSSKVTWHTFVQVFYNNISQCSTTHTLVDVICIPKRVFVDWHSAVRHSLFLIILLLLRWNNFMTMQLIGWKLITTCNDFGCSMTQFHHISLHLDENHG